MSEQTASTWSMRVLAYGVVGLAIVFELIVVWWMLHPQVPPDYRAYYIDHTTTCLNQPVSGDYVLGTPISFRDDGRAQAMPLRVCGWEGPAGDGTHAVGETSRLRFALPESITTPLTLSLELVAVVREGHPSQRVVIEINGRPLQSAVALAGVPLHIDVALPAGVVDTHPDRVEVALQFPDAIAMSPGDSNTRKRSIKLLSARLGTATNDIPPL